MTDYSFHGSRGLYLLASNNFFWINTPFQSEMKILISVHVITAMPLCIGALFPLKNQKKKKKKDQ